MLVIPRHPKHCSRVRICGFTMIELLITMALVAILAAIAFPSYREFNVRMKVSDTTNELVHAMHLARAEAAKRGVDVVVQANGSWTSGWQVIAGGDVILDRGALGDGYTVTAKSTGGGADDEIAFQPMGSLLDATLFDFNVCRPDGDSDDAQSRRITVQGSGTVASRRDVTGSPAPSCP